QAFGITPLAGVVHQQGVLDAVLGVVDGRRVVGVDDLDQVAVGGQGVAGFVDGDGAVERAMHGVATQQAGALDQVVLGALAHDDGAQAQAVTATGFLDQDASQQAADAAEAVEHDIGAFTGGAVLLAGHVGQFVLGELFDAATGTFGLELGNHLAQVNRGGAQLELAHGLENREGVMHGELVLAVQTVTGETMGLEDIDHRTVDQATAVDRGHDVVVAVQLTDHRNHRFCEGFTVDPLTETLVGLLSHEQYLPHVGAEKRGYMICRDRCPGNARLSRLTATGSASYNRRLYFAWGRDTRVRIATAETAGRRR